MFPPTSPTSASFPLYFLPPNPFRRRSSAATATSSSPTSHPPSLSSSPTTTPSTSPAKPSYLSAQHQTSYLRCAKCLSDILPASCIISKGFTGRHGRAYLVSLPSHPLKSSLNSTTFPLPPASLPNTTPHKPVARQLVTGPHTVADISCVHCSTVLGWKYVSAAEESQKYKVGKYILETRRVVRGVVWDDVEDEEDRGEVMEGRGNVGCGEELVRNEEGMKGKLEEDDVVFDSQNEDECEDLFSGLWTPKLALKRRRNRVV